MPDLIYKIVPESLWRAACRTGSFNGAAVDIQDGFIHFSTAAQVRETAQRHFAGQSDLLLVSFDAGAFGANLKWEPSRGGALFPHLYAPLDPALAIDACALKPDGSGTFVFPSGIP
jgi:uncharacterized protein (DUF952 family)